MVTLRFVEIQSLPALGFDQFEFSFTYRLPIVIEHMLRRPDLHAAVRGEEGPRTTLKVTKLCYILSPL